VIDATGKEDVKRCVDFARSNGVRLVVKGTGVDYIGRYVTASPFIYLSGTWVHYSWKI